MKHILIVVFVVSFCGCVKIQKKSDLEVVPEQVAIQQTSTVPVEPVIFVLDQVLTLDKDLEIAADEVYLKSGAKIYTNQFNLNIKSKSVTFDRGAQIQTFAENNSRALMEVSGLDGGVVHIVSEVIKGNLQLFMNGQAGGEGLGGWTATQDRSECEPNSGKNAGSSGSFFLEAKDANEFFMTTSMKVAEGGAIGRILESMFFGVLDLAKKYKINDQKSCWVVPHVGKTGIPGQICTKLSTADRPVCEKF